MSSMMQTETIYKQPESLMKDQDREDASSDKALLTEILQKYEGDPWLRITNVEITGACKVGDNYMSTVQRAYVEGVRSNEKPFHKYFILKRQLEDSKERELLKTDQVWANEEYMYFTVMPRLRRHCTVDLPHPKLYYSSKELMVMEDLKEKGYSTVNKFDCLDLEHSLLAIKALALFHSSSLAMKILDYEMFSIMKENLKHPYNNQDGAEMGKLFIQQTLEGAMKMLKTSANGKDYDDLITVLERVREKCGDYVDFLNQNSWNRDLSVVIHGDAWINNLLFSYEGNSRIPKICKFVDFQGTRMGSLVLDILQLIYTSVQSRVRKENFDILIREYYTCLISYLKSFVGPEKSDEIKSLTFDKFQEEMNTYKIYGLINTLISLPFIMNDVQIDSDHLSIAANYGDGCKERLVDVLNEYKNFKC